MSKGTSISEDMLLKARLGGLSCKALAWTEATRVEMLDPRGNPTQVPGVRTWHGKAVVEVEALPRERWYNHPIRYEGTLLDEDQEREISADVFISFMKSDLTGMASEERNQKESSRHVLYVEFTGAGSPR